MIGKGVVAAVGLACVALVTTPAVSAQAQNKEMSDKSVGLLMQYAWSMTPHKFTTPQGKVIEINKTKPNEVIVPLDTAREVVRVARMTAYAQLCELPEEQASNYQTLMRREEAKSKWTDQQLLYINQLHLFTVMTLTGKVSIVERDGDKEVVVKEGKAVKTETCTDTERQKIQAQIASYVGAAAPPAAGSAPAPGKRAEQPATAVQKK